MSDLTIPLWMKTKLEIQSLDPEWLARAARSKGIRVNYLPVLGKGRRNGFGSLSDSALSRLLQSPRLGQHFGSREAQSLALED
jgi:uncharacterized SAM-binding protein YcdF (DUF218 family)